MTMAHRPPNPASDRLSDADLAEWADWEEWQNQAEWQDIADAGHTEEDHESILVGAVEDPQWLDQMTRQLLRRGLGADQ
ncbi:MAG: hypothetical protein OEU46_20030 [Alphaproteobacteria bacterium]|nr:hypothetical protein [Alphaproteobacteria bacterium]